MKKVDDLKRQLCADGDPARPETNAAPSARERPSTHGAIVGEAIAQIAESVTGELPSDCCATCAFRRGTMTNQMGSTVLDAFKCAVGADLAHFACHHGMKDGEPSKVCAGWLACQVAGFEDVKRISAAMVLALQDMPDSDPIRAAFDAWIAQVDPTGEMDDYQRGRLYLRKLQTAPTPEVVRPQAHATGQAPGAKNPLNTTHEGREP